ncbi:MAG TPA: M48 family metallopeptidase [Gemmataceae bacterium]|jgi:predicted Zn-dependent protease|nr:M48 family metallopeptidase [Gemmataceae bacterium]
MRRSLQVLILFAAFASGCSYQADDGNEARRGDGPGGRDQPLALAPRQEMQVGRKAYAEVLDQYRDRILPNNHPDVHRVNRVVAPLIKAAQNEPLQREINLRVEGYVYEWQVTVVQERQVNAFCLPGGKIVVFTGILPIAASDDQLATVLSHEMSHALAHHGSERIARQQAGGGKFTQLNYDRFQESEADHIGVFLMAFAGYDPNEAIAFWRRMESLSGGREPPEFLSDHPSHEARVGKLTEWAPKARAAKKAFDDGRVLQPKR